MKTLYAVWDTLANAIVGNIITLRNDMEAVRLFTGLLHNKETNVGAYPTDHELWAVADIGEHEKRPTAIAAVRRIATGTDIINALREESKE